MMVKLIVLVSRLPKTATDRVLIIAFLLNSFVSAAQSSAAHSVFVEALGSGGYYSVNYDRYLFESRKAWFSIRAGLCVMYPKITSSGTRALEYRIPVMLNRIQGKANNHFECGIGLGMYNGYVTPELSNEAKRKSLAIIDTFIGYRFQKKDGGLMFRIGATPFFVISERAFVPWGGLSFGYNF